MYRQQSVKEIRKKLKNGDCSIGSWIQIPHSSVAEIIGNAGYDWVAVDLEHGAITLNQLPDLFRSLELGKTVPLARVAEGKSKDCKQALDAGAAGVIVPMIESAEQLTDIISVCSWPPAGTRGVGFSRANLFGKYFDSYTEEAQSPFVVAMIESKKGLDNLKAIVDVDGLDALLVGPYDLSASMGCTAQFESTIFKETLEYILVTANRANVPCGIHVVNPSTSELQKRIEEGYTFIPYSIDSVFFSSSSQFPVFSKEN